ncbi:MAG: class IV adenylate cyclase [Proteobacteria bacterium]|nr:class IV adenylate cyclase [Pseudomonadota bacterium]MBU4010259.1 class IV adenylate cyclase [Pseudomonadota bacterium]MBU4035219.1 class IV adenylate cyclase [Pseudomonadota bacterium]
MEQLETEVKYYITDINALRNRLISLGAHAGKNLFEVNIRFDDKNKTLFTNKSLLRLRKDEKTTLTFKLQPKARDSRFKTLKEYEIETNDFATTCHILELLGFVQEQIYEKWRETLTIGSTSFCIDKMPYGNFLEIEGSSEEIIKYTSLLGLDWKKRIVLNYLEMFEILKESLNFPFSDVTFDNFNNIMLDFSEYHSIVAAGDL